MLERTDVMSFAEEHADEVTLLENGKLRFNLTGMEFPATATRALLTAYAGGRALSRAKNDQYDYDAHQPYLVPHRERNERYFLYCKLTGKTVPRIPHKVQQHVNGRRYKNLYKEALRKQEEKRIRLERAREARAERKANALKSANGSNSHPQENGHDDNDGDDDDDDNNDDDDDDDDEGDSKSAKDAENDGDDPIAHVLDAIISDEDASDEANNTGTEESSDDDEAELKAVKDSASKSQPSVLATQREDAMDTEETPEPIEVVKGLPEGKLKRPRGQKSKKAKQPSSLNNENTNTSSQTESRTTGKRARKAQLPRKVRRSRQRRKVASDTNK